MLSVYLALVLGQSRVPVSVYGDPSSYLCDTSIDGSKCSSKGMAIYATYDDPPTRPSTFYIISHTQWCFTASSNSKYLGISSSSVPNISGKFSGVFTAPSTGYYTFQITVRHKITSNVCYFSLSESPAFVEADLEYSGTGEDYGGTCYVVMNTACADPNSQTEYCYCKRLYYLVSGNKYPLFAGARYNYAIPHAANLWLKLLYVNPSGTVARIGKEAIGGLTGYTAYATTSSDSSSSTTTSSDSSSSITTSSVSSGSSVSSSTLSPDEYTASMDDELDGDSSSVVVGSKKASGAIIGGSCAGGFVVVVVCAVTVWIFVRRTDKKGESSGGNTVDQRKDSNESGQRVGSGRTSRSGYDRTSRMSSVRGSRVNSGRTTREGDDRTSRMSSVRGSRVNSGRTSRSGYDRTSRMSSVRGSRSNSGRTSRSGHDRSSRMSSVRGSRSNSGRTSREGDDYGGFTSRQPAVQVGY